MNNTAGSDSSDTNAVLINNVGIVLDDTLTRKLPSFTFEKIIKDTKVNRNKQNTDPYERKTSTELVFKDKPYENSDHDGSEIAQSNTSGFELNLDGGSPMLNKFRNPFDETPDSKLNHDININRKNVDADVGGDVSTLSISKTPSKNNRLQSTSSASKLLDFFDHSLNNPVDKFRALKEKQYNLNEYGYQQLDTSNIGLVIDIRRSDDESNDENSMVDESSIKLNLIPTIRKKNSTEETQKLDNIATQADGNIHEEANRLSREQISKLEDNYNDNDDDEYFLIKDEDTNNKRLQSFAFLIDRENDGDEEKHVNNNKNVILSDGMKRNQTVLNETKTHELLVADNSNSDANNNSSKDTLKISKSDLKINEKVIIDKAINIQKKTVNNDNIPNDKLSLETTQELSDSESDNEKIILESTNNIGNNNGLFHNSGNILNDIVKETQVIDNFSQSLIIEEDDEEQEKPMRDKKDNEMDNNEEEEENGDDNDGGDDDDDDDEDAIRVGRNILQTFLIKESQSQPQSQVQTQSQFQARTSSSANSLVTVSPLIADDKDAETEERNILQITASEPNDTFDNVLSSELNIPDAVKFNQGDVSNNQTKFSKNDKKEKEDEMGIDIDLNHISSPLDLAQNFDVENTQNSDKNSYTVLEIPNTSNISVSKIDIEMDTLKINKAESKQSLCNSNNKSNQNTSTPILRFERKSNITAVNNISKLSNKSKHSVIEKLNEVLNKDGNSEESDKQDGLQNEDILNALNDDEVIEREIINKDFKIDDVLECEHIFYMNESLRTPGRIIAIAQTGDNVYVTVKHKSDEIILDHSKIYAPICFTIGDTVKYVNDRKCNYLITGLKKSKEYEYNDFRKLILTLDGYDKLLIQKKKMKNNNNNNNKFNEEIEVSIDDIYLTGSISKNYKFKLFNKQEDFNKYIEYQLNKFHSLGKGSIPNIELNPDDTLLNNLPANKTIDVRTNTTSFINNLRGSFFKCLFIVTGLSNHSRIGSSNGDSKNNTPRHQKDKDSLPMIIAFIKSQGGVVLQESGFEDIIRFKNVNNNNGRNKRLNYGINISPRKAKMTMINGMNNYDENGTNEIKSDKNFRNFKNLENETTYFKINFNSKSEKEEGITVELEECFKDFEFACVLSTRHSRTLKYLECLCLKWPVLHLELIKKCMNNKEFLQNWRNEWMKFQLIAGECSKLNCSIGADVFHFYDNWKLGKKLDQQMTLNRLFNKKRIIIINETIDILKKRGIKIKSDGGPPQKRRKIRNNDHGNRREEHTKESEYAEESDVDDNDTEVYKTNMNTPVNVGTLLWIFKHIGFEETLILKDNSEIMKQIASQIQEDQSVYLYFQHGNDIEKFQHLLGLPQDRCVNWEWIVQKIICNNV